MADEGMEDGVIIREGPQPMAWGRVAKGSLEDITSSSEKGPFRSSNNERDNSLQGGGNPNRNSLSNGT